MEIKIPAPAEEILTKLNENGYEAYWSEAVSGI